MTNKPIKIVFAPGCLEQMEQEMSPEDLQQLMNDLQASLEAGTLFDESREIDLEELGRDDPEMFKVLTERLEAMEDTLPPTLN